MLTIHEKKEILMEAAHLKIYHQLFQSLSELNIDFLVFKGTHLAYEFYPSAHLRKRIDTDLLIKKNDQEKISRLFHRLGYYELPSNQGDWIRHQTTFHKRVFDSISISFDLHWKLFEPQLLSQTFSFSELWNKKVWSHSLGCFVPDLYFSLLIAILHWYSHHHQEEEAKWILDFELLFSKIENPSYLFYLAKQKKISSLIANTILYLFNAGDCRLPYFWKLLAEEELKKAPIEKSSYYLKAERMWLSDIAMDLDCIDSLHHKLSFIKQHFIPSHRLNNPIFTLKRFMKGLPKLFKPH